MYYSKHAIIYVVLTIMMFASTSSRSAHSTNSLVIKCENPYQVPSLKAMEEAQLYFNSLFLKMGDDSGSSQPVYLELHEKKWEEHALFLTEIQMSTINFLSLKEKKETCNGRGSYVFKPQSHQEKPVILQAPHVGSDKNTGKIVERLFLTGDFLAASWNSNKRNEKRVMGDDVADLSRAWKSYFMAFARAFAFIHEKGTLVQIHGFSKKKRKTLRGSHADIILSHGHQRVSESLLKLKTCLKGNFKKKVVYVYPIDVNELGATTNSIGQSLRLSGFRQFIHIEISASLRKQLLKNKSALSALATCLSGVADVN